MPPVQRRDPRNRSGPTAAVAPAPDGVATDRDRPQTAPTASDAEA